MPSMMQLPVALCAVCVWATLLGTVRAQTNVTLFGALSNFDAVRALVVFAGLRLVRWHTRHLV